MLRLPRRVLFAIEAVLDIACHTRGAPVRSIEICRRQGIPRRYLEQALQQLVRAGILAGLRGPKGGYRLARERRLVSVGDIVRVVDRVAKEDDIRSTTDGSELGSKVVRPLWLEMEREMIRRLDGITIDDLCRRAHDAGLAQTGEDRLDFSI